MVVCVCMGHLAASVFVTLGTTIADAGTKLASKLQDELKICPASRDNVFKHISYHM